MFQLSLARSSALAVCLALLSASVLTPQTTPNYTIGTVAGGGVPNGVAATTMLLRPLDVAVDSQGNYYATDGLVVYRISAAGVVTPVAGNGRAGYSGDGGPATSAQLNNASGVAVDVPGNLYIADTNNHVIRKVNTSGVISTIVGTAGAAGYSGDGGLATVAQLRLPQAVTVDAAGTNLYISDTGNNVVRLVNNGSITTFAGNGASADTGDGIPATFAGLYQPAGLALDSTNALYIADRLHHKIRKVSGGLITTVAGSGLSGYTGNGGTATAARLNSPQGVSVDLNNVLYIADTGNSVIRQVTSNGVITTIAGTIPWYSGDGGLAINAELRGPQRVLADNRGNIFIADTQNNRLRKVVQATGVISTFAGGGTGGDGGAAISAQLIYPRSAAIDRNGNIYVSDAFDHRVRKFWRGGAITTVAGNGQAGYAGDGGPATSASLFGPAGLAFDAQNNLYIADSSNNVVRKVTPGGIISTVAGSGTAGYSGDSGAAIAATLRGPTSVAVDSSGALYIADTGNNVIRKVVAGLISSYAGNGTVGYSGDGGAAAVAQFSVPLGIAIDGANNLYVADYGNAAVRRISNGIITTVAGSGPALTGFSGDGSPAVVAQLNQPQAVAVDGSGNVFIVDYGNNRVREVNTAGIISTIAGGGPGISNDGSAATAVALNGLQGVAVDTNQIVYVTELGTERVRSLTTTTVPVTITTNPVGLTVVVDGVTWTAPVAQQWIAGSSHTIGTASPQGAMTYQSWSDGGSLTHTVTAPASTAAYTAIFSSGAACTYQLAAVSANVAASASTGSVGLTTQAGCPYAASSGAAWITITGGASGTGSSTVSYSVAANASTTARNGTLTIGGQTFTIAQAGAASTGATPTVAGIFPASSGGATQTLTIQFSDADGYADLDVINVLINTYLDGRQACYLAYVRSSNVLYIVPDSGDGSQITGKAMDGTGSISNSQCSVTMAGSSVTGSGNTLTMTLNMSFTTTFAGANGNKVIYAAARDQLQHNSGWQTIGTHAAPGGNITYPRPVSASPSGSGPSQMFTFVFQDASSALNLQTAWVLISTAVDARHACVFAYYRPGNQIYLYPDSGDGSQSTVFTLTGSNTASNSQCTVSAQGANVSTSGNTLTLTLPITFNSGAFSGSKGIWLADQTLGGAATSAWQALGAWLVL